MRRRSVLLLIGTLAIVVVGGLSLTGLPPFDGPLRATSAAEAATIRPALQRAAERDNQLLGETSRTNFCALHIYGTDHALTPGQSSYVYAYANCAGIRPGRDPSRLTFGEGIESPVRYSVRGAGEGLTVTKLDTPGDGAAYGSDIRELFPRKVEQQIFSAHSGLGEDEHPDCTNLRAAQQRFGVAARGVYSVAPRDLAHCPKG